MNSKEMFSLSPSSTKSMALVKLSAEALRCIQEYARTEVSLQFLLNYFQVMTNFTNFSLAFLDPSYLLNTIQIDTNIALLFEH